LPRTEGLLPYSNLEKEFSVFEKKDLSLNCYHSFRYRFARLALPFFVLTCICVSSAQVLELKNSQIRATFGARGLTSVSNQDSSAQVRFKSDEFSFSIDQEEFDSAELTPKIERRGNGEIAYTYGAHGYTVNVVYKIRPDWHFVTKQLQISETPRAAYTVQSIEPVLMETVETIESRITPETYLPQYGGREDQVAEGSPRAFGMFLRFAPGNGLMLVVQNPFLTARANTNKASLSYQPEMEWRDAWGPFLSDIACIGPYKLTGDRIPARMVLEWQPPPVSMPRDGADRSEIEAFTDCVRAFLVHRSPSPISVEVGWTLNDYQVDVSTPEGRTEYKRIIDTTASLGIQHLLYAPANYGLAQVADDADDWNWEHVLWLGLGQQIRGGKWDAARGAIPPSVTEMLDYAKSKNVGLLAYVYPSLPFAQNSGWLVKNLQRPSKNVYATLASREFQDFLVRELLTFKRRTGITGYSFDYTYLNLPGSSSYAQWWGWRRVLESLRLAEPGIVIDGRQTYQNFGPWTWLAGSYPHPTGNDEQPESFTPYPDLHFDRVSADRMRFVNYWYRNYQFAPEEIVPGYMTHQTERSVNVPSEGSNGAERGKLMFTRYRARDWDYLGYRYSVISSIATAGWNSVMDMIPARDVEEFKNFSADEKAWIRHWLDWTTRNRDYLQQTRTILGQPALGKADGSSALIGDGGYLFLFNPNYVGVSADFRLDASIGLTNGKRFLIREIYPQEGRLIGKPGAGLWTYGDEVHLQLDGTSATVLQLQAAESEKQALPVFGSSPSHAGVDVRSTATLSGGTLRVEHASGEPGLQRDIGVLLSNPRPITNMTVNGHAIRYSQDGSYVSAQVRFAGQSFTRSEQIHLDMGLDGSLTGAFLVPRRIFAQLAARRKNWPIPWTSDDYESTWLAPERLLLFLQIAEPKDTMNPTMTLDGQPLSLKKAYSSVRVHAPSLVGFYADLSDLQADVQHKITVRLPGLAPGQFQGVFFDNVEPEYSEAIAE
jgi:hypothetical protein